MTTIHITQDNIDHGLRGSCTQCPVALALREAGFEMAYAGAGTLATERGCADTPAEVFVFMWDFDNLLAVEPFSFEVEL